jgi:hypothetical protein
MLRFYNYPIRAVIACYIVGGLASIETLQKHNQFDSLSAAG